MTRRPRLRTQYTGLSTQHPVGPRTVNENPDPQKLSPDAPGDPPRGADRGAYTALLVWLAGFAVLLALLLYDLLAALFRR